MDERTIAGRVDHQITKLPLAFVYRKLRRLGRKMVYGECLSMHEAHAIAVCDALVVRDAV